MKSPRKRRGALAALALMLALAALAVPAAPGGAQAGERMQLYLVEGVWIEQGSLIPPERSLGLIEQAVVPSLRALAKLHADGRMVAGGVAAGERRGVFIVEADSHDQVNAMLQRLPFWGYLTWKVTALQSYATRAEQEAQAALALRKALGK